MKCYYNSPLGWIEIESSDEIITSLMLCDEPVSISNQTSPIAAECVKQLTEYFNGTRTIFDLPMKQPGTPFQQKVWNALTEIPYGKTVSYAYIAQKINNPKSYRAVGSTNSKNKLWIIVPCHRVIGANGSLTGYAGGVERKKWLLEHEMRSS